MLVNCLNCRKFIQTCYGTDSKMTFRSGTRDDPRKPGDKDKKFCDVCCRTAHSVNMAPAPPPKYLIRRGGDRPQEHYQGFACTQAGIQPGAIYDSREEALADIQKINKFNPAEFFVEEVKEED